MNARQRRVTIRRLRREAVRLGLQPDVWQWRRINWLNRQVKRAMQSG